jgi:hypothetical protein
MRTMSSAPSACERPGRQADAVDERAVGAAVVGDLDHQAASRQRGVAGGTSWDRRWEAFGLVGGGAAEAEAVADGRALPAASGRAEKMTSAVQLSRSSRPVPVMPPVLSVRSSPTRAGYTLRGDRDAQDAEVFMTDRQVDGVGSLGRAFGNYRHHGARAGDVAEHAAQLVAHRLRPMSARSSPSRVSASSE